MPIRLLKRVHIYFKDIQSHVNSKFTFWFKLLIKKIITEVVIFNQYDLECVLTVSMILYRSKLYKQHDHKKMCR